MPPVAATGPVLILVCEMIRELCNDEQHQHMITIILCTITSISGPPHTPSVSCASMPFSWLSATLNPTNWTWPTTDSSKPWIPLL